MARNRNKSTEAPQDTAREGIVETTEPVSSSIRQESRYFVPREFTCNCNGYCDHPVAISPETVAKLDEIRDLIGKPLTVTSGTRCDKYNRMVGGTLGSAHIPRNGLSHAADIRCPDSAFRFAFLAAALPIFNRIGLGKDFIHVDDDPDLPPNVLWLY